MPTDSLHSNRPGDASQSSEPPWDAIAREVDALAAAWAGCEESPPDLRLIVERLEGELPPEEVRAVLHELIKTDLEYRWQRDCQPQRVEVYAEQLPQLGGAGELPVELIYEELQARVQAGDLVRDTELRERFPRQADKLCELLGAVAISGSPTCTYFADTQKASDVVLDSLSSQPPFCELEAGTTIDDFQLIAPLGRGAFAKVFMARQISMERLVALKVSAQTGAEPQTLAQLDHPGIVRVFDQRETDEPPARLLYMELVQGGTLQDVLSRVRLDHDADHASLTGQLLLDSVDERLGAVAAPRPTDSRIRAWLATASWPEAICRIGAELAEGLAYAHSRGVLHRDVKPANVLLSAEGLPKLADFNVSYNGGRADEDPTDAFGGSLAYMSPEQLEACHPLLAGSPQLVREQSDVYSLGVMLWEMLTGRRPFRDKLAAEGGSLVRLQRMIDSRRAANLDAMVAELPASVPQSLRQVLRRSLEPDKARRYESAAELAAALRLCLDPHAWQLLQPPKTAVGKLAVNHPVVAVVLAGLLPNLFTAPFNYAYNAGRMAGLEDAAIRERFDVVQLWINIFAFSIGIGLGVVIALKTLRQLRADSPREIHAGVSRVLSFSRFVSGMLLAIWTLSGVAFPIAIDWGQAITEGVGFHVHFFASLAVCGLASTAYPYFLITTLSVRYFVPELMRNDVVAGPRRADLDQVRTYNRLHLLLAAMVPMLGAFLLVAWGNTESVWATTALAAGALGFLAMFRLERMIELDLTALESAAVD